MGRIRLMRRITEAKKVLGKRRAQAEKVKNLVVGLSLVDDPRVNESVEYLREVWEKKRGKYQRSREYFNKLFK
jgi:hypothetical protein